MGSNEIVGLYCLDETVFVVVANGSLLMIFVARANQEYSSSFASKYSSESSLLESSANSMERWIKMRRVCTEVLDITTRSRL